MPAFDELALLDPVQADARNRPLFTRRFDVTDMLSQLMLSFMRGSRPPVHEDKVPLGGNINDLGPQVRYRLTPISHELFHPLNPRVLRMQRRMIMVVISEVLMHNIEVAPHNFLASALQIPPDKRLVNYDALRGIDPAIPTRTQRARARTHELVNYQTGLILSSLCIGL